MHHLDLLRTHRDQAALRERVARADLRSARAAVATAQAQIDADRRSLAASQGALAHVLVSGYKDGQIDAVAYVLAAGSFSDLVTRMDVLNRVSAADRQLIGQIVSAQRRLESAQKALRAKAAKAAAAAAAATNARAQLDAAVARSEAVLAHVNATIRGMLRSEQARRSKLAGSRPSGGGSPSSGGSHDNVFYGDCTWYGPGFAGQRTADGEIFDPSALTAASPWLPFGTQLRVTNLATGLSVQVRVNDRGPFGRGVLDLSAHAARLIHLAGWQRVRIAVLPAAMARPQITL